MLEGIKYNELNHLQIGKIAEYLTKLTLTLHGFDVYNTEVDDKGIDLLVRLNQDKYFDIQVKSLRIPRSGYVFIPQKKEWKPECLRDTLYLALVLFEDFKTPSIYLIPSTAWITETPLLRNHQFGEGKKSKPEWGVNISATNMALLQEFEFAKQIEQMKLEAVSHY